MTDKPYVVAMQRTYYPAVRFFDAEEEAHECADKWYEEEIEEDGAHDVTIVVAKVIRVERGKAHY